MMRGVRESVFLAVLTVREGRFKPREIQSHGHQKGAFSSSFLSPLLCSSPFLCINDSVASGCQLS